ncbi:hypothetical protein MIND_00189200 [Mycena indigotica]|uniref:Uncharacterized protein n=1 Tax=Mycena indigotica TaxID=2126181 RepID=A0A8H6T8A5_9AGAR|nr:uncharacterized protein MIND_00189200 [Mycena indigotica]KAF7311787.1 hypothetical protein MIND_00189200 [Mycena indigotica]
MAALTTDLSPPSGAPNNRPTGGAPSNLTCPPEDLDGDTLLPDLGLPVAAGQGLLVCSYGGSLLLPETTCLYDAHGKLVPASVPLPSSCVRRLSDNSDTGSSSIASTASATPVDSPSASTSRQIISTPTGTSAPATQTPLSGTTGLGQGGGQQTNPAAGVGGQDATDGHINHVFTTTITAADGSETTGNISASAVVHKVPTSSIVGGIIGVSALIAVLVWLFRRWRANVRRKREEQEEWDTLNGNVFKDHRDWLGREQRALVEDRDGE